MAETEYRRLSCGGCGDQFLSLRQRGRPPRTCTACHQTGRKAPSEPRADACIKPCAHCGEAIPQGKPSLLETRQFCSRACRGKSQRAKPTTICEECGIGFHRRKGGSELREGREPRFCGQVCSGQWMSRTRLAQYAEQREAHEREKAQRALIRTLKRIAKQRAVVVVVRPPCVCATCGEHYERRPNATRCTSCAWAVAKEARRRYNSARKKTPDGRARKLKDKALRRAKQSSTEADAIDPIRVFERDKWKCQLCGVRTPKKLRGTYEPQAPEVDHVVTLNDDGHHTWANVQCACRACNIRKGSRSLGQIGMGFM